MARAPGSRSQSAVSRCCRRVRPLPCAGGYRFPVPRHGGSHPLPFIFQYLCAVSWLPTSYLNTQPGDVRLQRSRCVFLCLKLIPWTFRMVWHLSCSTQGYSCKRCPLLLCHLNSSPHLDNLNLDQNFLGHLGGSVIKRLPLAQVMISRSWDRAPHQAPSSSGNLLLPLPLPLPLLVLSLCLSLSNE